MRYAMRRASAGVPGAVALALGLSVSSVPAAPTLAGALPATASALIEQAAAVEAADSRLSFGTIETTRAGGEVTLTPEGGVGGPAAYRFSGDPAAAGFTVTAAPHTAVTLTLAAALLTGPGTAMTLTDFSHDAGAQPATDATGSLSVRLGAALRVNPDQAPGAYSGTTRVIVNY